MRAHWLDTVATGAAFCTLLACLSFGMAKAEAAPLVIPGIGPDDQDVAVQPAKPKPRRAVPALPEAEPEPVAAAAPPAPAGGPAPSNLGGGFLEMLLTGRDPTPRLQSPGRPMVSVQPQRSVVAINTVPAVVEVKKSIDPQFFKQEVDYSGDERPGTIVIDTPHKFLYLVQPGHRALRYGIGVGRPGFEWAGIKTISRKAEWPDWTPPPEMLKRRPDLPTHMDGGPANPLGARAMYLGDSMYRIHGTNEPDTIGTNVSSGCIRMMNEDVTDLYERVRVGTKVIVM